MRRKLLLIGITIVAIMACAGIFIFNKVQMVDDDSHINNESSSSDNLNEKVYEYDSKYMFYDYIRSIRYENYIENEFEEIYEYYFSEKFMTKFKKATDLYSDIDSVFEVGRRVDDEKDDEVILIMDWKESTGKQFHTCVVYKLFFDNENKIDDCEIVDSYDIDVRTEQRLDRPMVIGEYDAEGFITVYLRPRYYSIDDEDRASYVREWGNIPKTVDCQIINLPQEPNKSCEVKFPCYKLEYMDGQTKYYKVNYTFNDRAQFTKIEFTEIPSEEYDSIKGLSVFGKQ